MLGRLVADRLRDDPHAQLVSEELAAITTEADLFVVNLECAISDRGERWPDPSKPFFFRAPPVAAEHLARLGVDCVTLANNHALDYGPVALHDTFEHLRHNGIRWTGAGSDVDEARRPAVFEVNGSRVAVFGATDHPEEFSATETRPGVAFADLRHHHDGWLLDAVRRTVDEQIADTVIVSPHWGPNMTPRPVEHVRAAAVALRAAGASLIAGHSAHVFHGVTNRILFDVGDFLDDYARDDTMHNDFGMLFLVTFEGGHPVRVEAIPLRLEHCTTRLADATERRWALDRFRAACAEFGTAVEIVDGRAVIEWSCLSGGDGVQAPKTTVSRSRPTVTGPV